MLSARKAPWTRYHNIIGKAPEGGFLGRGSDDSDGIVEYSSAHLEEAASEIVVPADHVNVHRHPLAVLEVRRILLEQLAELRRQPSYDDGLPRTAALPLPMFQAPQPVEPAAYGGTELPTAQPAN